MDYTLNLFAAFQNEFTLCDIKPNFYRKKNKFASHEQYLLSLLSSKNAKRLAQIKYTTQTFNPLSANPAKWSNTLKQFIGKLPTNCLSVFDRFVGLALKGLKVPAAKKHFLQRVFYWYILLRYFLFSVIIGKRCFS